MVTDRWFREDPIVICFLDGSEKECTFQAREQSGIIVLNESHQVVFFPWHIVGSVVQPVSGKAKR